MDNKNSEYERYVELFRERLKDLYKFINGIFSAFVEEWGGGFTILPPNANANDHRFEVDNQLSPICFYVRNTLQLRKYCYECYKCKVEEVINTKMPAEYWCTLGMREIAVPIIIHGFCVGVIICGQQIIKGEKDDEGIEIMKKFAMGHGLEEYIPIMLEKRSKSKAMSYPDDIDEIRNLMIETSQYISTLLYKHLEDNIVIRKKQLQDRINDLFNKLSVIGFKSSKESFWSDLRGTLHMLKNLFDCRGIAIFLSQDGETKAMSCNGVPYRTGEVVNGKFLMTSQVDTFDGPHHLLVGESPEHLSCPVCKKIVEEYVGVDLIVYDKSKLGVDGSVHFFVFFDSTIPHRNDLLLHEKKQILSQFILEAVNTYFHLEKVQQLNQLLKEKQEFLMDVAHQVRQPLHSIVSYCDYLLMPEVPNERKGKIIKYLREIAKNSSISVDCLVYSGQGDQGTFALGIVPSSHSLSKLLFDYAIGIQGYSEDKGIQISVDNDTTDQIGKVFVDKSKLEIAMHNVLFNAVKYSFPNTTITVTTYNKQDGWLEIHVTNYGIEIPMACWEEIFQRGYRTPTARKYLESGGGMGIGLFITLRIMTAMKGKAFVYESIPTEKIYEKYKEYRNTFVLALPGSVILEKGDRRNV